LRYSWAWLSREPGLTLWHRVSMQAQRRREGRPGTTGEADGGRREREGQAGVWTGHLRRSSCIRQLGNPPGPYEPRIGLGGGKRHPFHHQIRIHRQSSYDESISSSASPSSRPSHPGNCEDILAILDTIGKILLGVTRTRKERK
jgi:hypothetical protein